MRQRSRPRKFTKFTVLRVRAGARAGSRAAKCNPDRLEPGFFHFLHFVTLGGPPCEGDPPFQGDDSAAHEGDGEGYGGVARGLARERHGVGGKAAHPRA